MSENKLPTYWFDKLPDDHWLFKHSTIAKQAAPFLIPKDSPNRKIVEEGIVEAVKLALVKVTNNGLEIPDPDNLIKTIVIAMLGHGNEDI